MCVQTKGCMQGTVWIEPDNMRVYAGHGGANLVLEGVLHGVVGVDPVCIGRRVCKGGLV